MAWHCKARGEYARTSTEAIDNAKEIYSYLSGLGWTLNAVCGMLGNIGKESAYNPWRWQGDKVGSTSGSPWRNQGYGLVQFTNAGKYINSEIAKGATGYGPNFSNKAGKTTDGIAQLYCISINFDGGYFVNKNYNFPLTWSQFKSSTDDAGYLAKAWLHNYERPADQSEKVENVRSEEAEYWWDVLQGESPTPTPTPTPGNLKVSLYNRNTSGVSYCRAVPDSGLSEGDSVNITTVIGKDAEGNYVNFDYFDILYGEIEIDEENHFTMPNTNVIIEAYFDGEDTPPTPIKPDKTFKSWYLKPWWIQNTGQ